MMRPPVRSARSRAARRLAGILLPAVVLLGSGRSALAQSEVPSARQIVDTLASDDMRGRGAGSKELEHAMALVEGWMNAAGLKPGLGINYRQYFIDPAQHTLTNVIGRLDGSGDEWMVVGAHYDGLGVGAEGTDFAGQILNGADDNASGVAVLLRAARLVAQAGPLARTVFFVAFSGEEQGTLGSKEFVGWPPRNMEKCVAMLNFDTVGRMADDRLIVFGTGTAEEFPDLLRGVDIPFGFDLAFRTEGAGASDHTPFFEKGIPVLHFFSGANADYHAPGDDPDKVDADSVEKLAEFSAELITHLAGEEVPLTFRPAGADLIPPPGAEVRKRTVSFGSIPDFSQESGGILLSGVMPGGPAEEAGLAAGDVLVEIGGESIDTIQDFQAVLSEHEPGDVVHVRFMRHGTENTVDVTLRAREH